MANQELERKKNQIVREVQRLLIDLEELEDEVTAEEPERGNESILDMYIPKGLRNIHRLLRLGL